MEAETVLAILDALDRDALSVCVDGGWGVDGLLGAQHRPHRDLDLIIDADDSVRVRRCLAGLRYSDEPDGTAFNYVLRDPNGNRVDVHAIRFDSRGFGHFPLPDGGTWPFPPAAFRGVGWIAGREVRCLSPDAQVQCHGQGYEPTGTDLEDMERLQERFGVVLPLILCRCEG